MNYIKKCLSFFVFFCLLLFPLFFCHFTQISLVYLIMVVMILHILLLLCLFQLSLWKFGCYILLLMKDDRNNGPQILLMP